LNTGDTFWALKGVRDGHDFVLMRLAKAPNWRLSIDRGGKRMEIGHPPPYPPGHEHARGLEQSWSSVAGSIPCPVIGITGSNGKTSTKDLILRLLSLCFQAAGTKGNLNNDLGVPLTILDIPASAQIAIVEMAPIMKVKSGSCVPSPDRPTDW